jgi:NAD(P)-dependent dehydrogenase (short-subunit alcohol dehydrogenase family)
MKSIKGKVFIVTGASKGIGKVISEFFLKSGASVVISGRNTERLEAVRTEFMDAGFSTIAVAADLTLPEDCVRLVESAIDEYGKIDGLVNNAGLPMRGRFENMDAGLFADVIAANLLTAANCCKAALPELIKTRGSIIFISSVACIHGLPNASPYSAAKAGLEKYAESLRIEMSPHGMHIGTLRLGLVNPPSDKVVLRDDGTYKPVTSKGHQSQESVARAVIRMVMRRRGRITMTALGKFNSVMNWLSPWLVRLVLTKTQFSKKYEG